MPNDISNSTTAVKNVSTRRMDRRGNETWCNATNAIPWLECPPVKLAICAIASEVVPLAKSGGLADVASALSRQLTLNGHDVRLFVPFYTQIRRDKLELAR